MPLTPPPLIQPLTQGDPQALSQQRTRGNIPARAWAQFFTDLYQTVKSLSSSTVNSVIGTSPIVSSGGNTPNISLANTTVHPGSYTNTNLTVDQQGRITAASNGSGSNVAPFVQLAITDPIDGSNVDFSLPQTVTTLQVFLNGQLVSAADYVFSGGGFTTNFTPIVGDTLDAYGA